MADGLAAADWAVLGLYFAAVFAVGLCSARARSTTAEFFLGSRSVSWFAVLVSVVATEISAATFLGVPSASFAGDFNYLQFGIGSLLARFVVGYGFLPAYFRHRSSTPYGWLGERFGPEARRAGALCFLVSRLSASSVRLLLAAIGVGYVLGWPVGWSILLFCVLSVAYTSAGGLRAVILTDAVQAVVFIGGGLAACAFLIGEMGLPGSWAASVEAGKFTVFHFAPEGSGLSAWISDSAWFWIALLNGLVMSTAALACDQDLTQRLLSCRTLVEARRSVILSGVLGIPVAALFLLVGAGLFNWYANSPVELVRDREFAHFIVQDLPAGLRGFLIAGIFAAAMSSLDSAMNALSSSVVLDFDRRDAATVEASPARRSRWMVVLVATLLGLLAFGFHLYQQAVGENLLWLGFQVAGVTLGPLLGVFTFGLLLRAARSGTAVALALGSGVLAGALLLVLIHLQWIPLAWTWVVLAAGATSFVACGLLPTGRKSE